MSQTKNSHLPNTLNIMQVCNTREILFFRKNNNIEWKSLLFLSYSTAQCQ